MSKIMARRRMRRAKKTEQSEQERLQEVSRKDIARVRAENAAREKKKKGY